jgi:hypothetical protein
LLDAQAASGLGNSGSATTDEGAMIFRREQTEFEPLSQRTSLAQSPSRYQPPALYRQSPDVFRKSSEFEGISRSQFFASASPINWEF